MQHAIIRLFVLFCLCILIALNVSGCAESPESLAKKQERHDAWYKKLGNCSKVDGVLKVRSCPAFVTYEVEKGLFRAILVIGLYTDGTIHYVRASDQLSTNDGWTIDPKTVHIVSPSVGGAAEQFKLQRRWVEE